MGAYPPPRVCPKNVLNLWKYSPYESQPFEDENDPDIDHDAVNLFQNHISILCNTDENQTSWIISWFAHCFQRPGEKTLHAIHLIGIQGIGKSLILNVVKTLLGPGKTLETSSPEQDCLGSFNAPTYIYRYGKCISCDFK